MIRTQKFKKGFNYNDIEEVAIKFVNTLNQEAVSCQKYTSARSKTTKSISVSRISKMDIVRSTASDRASYALRTEAKPVRTEKSKT